MSSLKDRIAAPRTSSADPGACRYIVGRNRDGNWIAVETHGRAGGVFVSRAAALHYAKFETDHRPSAVSVAVRPVDLKL